MPLNGPAILRGERKRSSGKIQKISYFTKIHAEGDYISFTDKELEHGNKAEKKTDSPRIRMSRPDDLLKRSYYMRECIADTFKEANHGDVLLPTNGAQMLWLALKEYPSIRDAAVDAACRVDVHGIKAIEDKDAAVLAEANKLLDVVEEAVWEKKLNAYLGTLSRKDQYALALQAEQDAAEPGQAKPKRRKH